MESAWDGEIEIVINYESINYFCETYIRLTLQDLILFQLILGLVLILVITLGGKAILNFLRIVMFRIFYILSIILAMLVFICTYIYIYMEICSMHFGIFIIFGKESKFRIRGVRDMLLEDG